MQGDPTVTLGNHFCEDQVYVDLREDVIHNFTILAQLDEALAIQVRFVCTVGSESILQRQTQQVTAVIHT